MEFGKSIRYDIHIIPTMNNGFVVNVGCQTFAYGDKNSLIKDLAEYFDTPEKMERRFSSVQSEPQPCPPQLGEREQEYNRRAALQLAGARQQQALGNCESQTPF